MKKNTLWLFGTALFCFGLVSCSKLSPSTAKLFLQSVSVPGVKTGGLTSLGQNPRFLVTVQDERGTCGVKASLVQGAVQKELLSYQSPQATAQANNLELFSESSDLLSQGFTEGSAELHVMAEDCSFLKRGAKLSQKIAIDITPPRVDLMSTQHYINQGGADVVLYRVTGDSVWSGVTVGGNQFKGYPKPGALEGNGEHFALFVFSYDLPQDTQIEVVAMDAAGNKGKTTLTPSKFFAKEFRHRDLVIDDSFITTKVADIISNTPSLKNTGDNLKNFLSVNRDLRKINNQFLLNLAAQSAPGFYWKDAFRPLTNAAIEASFADYRNYLYQDKKIDEQVHLGFDLAVVEHHPVLAANDGKVLFSGYLGIYGNTVVMDHGYGVMTLYAHLSALDVKKGDVVTRDQKLGNSGATGLAGGDHLHFSMLIQGVQTNPVEFWDQHWIDDHVYLRLNKAHFAKEGVL